MGRGSLWEEAGQPNRRKGKDLSVWIGLYGEPVDRGDEFEERFTGCGIR